MVQRGVFLFFLFIPFLSVAQPVSSAAVFGTGEYRESPVLDPDVLSSNKTELWARVFWPEPLAQKSPVIVFLHGNHGTCGKGQAPRNDHSCEYTNSGVCPSGYTVTPNHEGYNYAATHLATKGFIVVSINANLGITCGAGEKGDWGLVLARGRLILRHLEKLKQWNDGQEPLPASLAVSADFFKGKVDLTQVGIMGHSRGGEGARAAYNLLNDPGSPWASRIPNLKIRGIYEIGAVDGQSDRILDAYGTAWNQLLPMCDGDVSDLEGRNPFERMLGSGMEKEPANKSLLMVWGANHNFFNTEWQQSDSYGCLEHNAIFDSQSWESKPQQAVFVHSAQRFFTAHVGSQRTPNMAQTFDPAFPLPTELSAITRIERDFVPGLSDWLSKPIENFSQVSSVQAMKAQNVLVEHLGFVEPRAVKLEWSTSGPNTYFEIPWNVSLTEDDWKNFNFLDLRLQSSKMRSDTDIPLDFSVQLGDKTGHFSDPITALSFGDFRGPANSVITYQTLRLPLSSFTGIERSNVDRLRLSFDRMASGGIYLSGVRLSASSAFVPALQTQPSKEIQFVNDLRKPVREEAFIKTIVRSNSHRQLLGEPAFEISFASAKGFPISNALPVLRAGEKVHKLSRLHFENGKANMVFVISQEEFKQLKMARSLEISIGKFRRWQVSDLGRVKDTK